MLPVTTEELVRAAGVSVSTVSRALTKSSHRVNEKTRQQIIQLAESMGYQPNMMARGLRTNRTSTALGAIYAVPEAGLVVPDDITVVGYDDRPLASYVRPALTCVSLPCYEMGEASARMILNLLENPSSVTEEVQVPGKLVIRQSCGALEGKRASEAPTRRFRRRIN